jgi:hypothetical protein
MNRRTEQRLDNLRHARNSFVRTLRSKMKAKYRRRLGIAYTPQFSKSPLTGIKKDWADLHVPSTLCLETNFDETVRFIREVRTMALWYKRPVRIMFDDVKAIKPSAMLLLLAEIHRCRLVRGARMVTGTYPNDVRLERMLCAMGFFDILGVRERVLVKRTYPMNYIRFASASRLKEHQARQLRSELLGDKIVMQPKPRKRLQRAITEAMLNCVQHAYPKESVKTHPGRNRWWLSGTYNRKTKNLTIMFCDLGVGIPETVTKLYLLEKIRAAVSLLPGVSPDDGQMIMAAMELGRTRTGEQGRGKGLNDLRKFIDHAGNGELKIFSKKGIYTYFANGTEKAENRQYSIGGTLIKWRVPIANVTDWSGDDDVDNDETVD